VKPEITKLLMAVLCFAGIILLDDREPKAENQKEQTIDHTDLAAFTLIGIEARTTNAKEAGGNGVIPEQWRRFFSEGILQKIPDRIDSNIYAVYSEYASDHNGEYSYLIGTKVKDDTTAPSGMVAKHVLAGQYAVFTSDKGPFPKVVPEAWQKIFGLEDEGKLKRAYRTDFELYDQRAQDPQNGQLDIYVGLK
jgi:predicted transcriptional regulator YdeE